MRLELNGDWDWVADPTAAAAREGWTARPPRRGRRTMPVPGVWQMQEPDYHGPALYSRRIAIPETARGERLFLVFAGSNYLTHVFLDGRPVGVHEGGYTGFEFEITHHARPGGEHLLTVWVIHSPPRQNILDTDLCDVASSKETWYYPYAGLWGGVTLETRPAVFIADFFAAPHLARRRVEATLTVAGAARAAGAWEIRDGAGRRRAAGRFEARGTGRTARAQWRVVLPAPRAWTPEDPHLYTLHARLDDGHAHAVRFGLRDVQLRRDGLLLNGRPFYVKGILLQPNYPETLIHPSSDVFARREMARIREGGFNLVRAHLKPMTPAALDAADELGLLVYAESALAWIRRGPHLLRRAALEMRAMLARDRNHPCIALWGLVNESGRTDRRIRRRMFRLAYGLDPTRPVIGNSGAASIAPQGGWSGQTEARPARALDPMPFEDVHVYARAPVPRVIFELFRKVGDPERMPATEPLGLTPAAWIAPWQRRLRRTHPRIFLSEYGYGGMMDFAAVAAQFSVRRGQDARQYAEFAQALERGFRRRGLAREFGDLATFIRRAQAVQAEGDRRQTEAIRLNPRITGYVLTQLNDVGWECSAGLLDPWRNAKPAYHAMRKANASIVGVVLPVRRNLRPGDPVRVQGWVTADAPPGPCELRVSLHNARGKALGRTAWRLAGRGVRLAAGTAGLGEAGGPGTYELRHEVWARGQVLAAGRESLHVFPATPDFEPPTTPETVRGDWRVVRDPAALTPDQWRALAARVREGAQALITELTPAAVKTLQDAGAFPWSLKCVQASGAFVGQFHYLCRLPIWAGLPVGDPASEALGEILPQWTLGELPKAQVLAGAFTVSTFTVPGDAFRHRGQVDWFMDIADIPHGKGRVRLCQHAIWNNDPLAQVMRFRLLG